PNAGLHHMGASLSLENIDPIQAWEPWKPSEKDPWNLKWAGHLYRRAAFGAPIKDIRFAVDQGLDATVKDLLGGGNSADSRAIEREIEAKAKTRDPMDPNVYGVGPQELQAWWVYTLLQKDTSPLREKMTLFWHNHFATSIAKVKSPMAMLTQ